MDESADIREAPVGPMRVVLVMWGLIGLTIALYGRVATYHFISYDDYDYVLTNPNLKDGLSLPAIKWAFTTGERANWHPVTWLSYLLDVSIFGVRPGPMHVVNMLLHAANTALLFLLLVQLTSNLWPSAWAAALFAWHPLHVESVAWIAERKDVLCAFFMLLCLVAYVRYVRSPSQRGYAAVLLLLILALLSKPMAVTLPCVMLLLDFWPLRRMEQGKTLKSLVIEKVPLFAVVLISSIITFAVQSAGESVASVSTFPVGMRLANAVAAYGAYLRMTIAPYRLAIFYPHPSTHPAGTISISGVVISGIVIALVTVLAWRLRKSMPWITVGWLWYVGTLVPVIGIVQVGKQSMADRYTYIPLVGIFIALAWTGREAFQLLGRRGRGVIGSLAVVSVLVAAGMAWGQIGYWRNTESVMRHAIGVVPYNYVAHGSLADALDEKGDVDGAVREYQTVLSIRPDDPVALYSLAKFAARQGRTADAIDLYERAIAADPSIPAAFNNLGLLYGRIGRLEDAINAYRKALVADNTLELAHLNLANSLMRKGQLPEAIEHFQRATSLRPDFADAHFALGQGLLVAGRPQEGVASLKRAAQLQPQRVDILNRLAWTLATWPDPSIHDGPTAISVAAAACQITQNSDPTSLDILAAALARNRQFDQALSAAQRAADLADAQRNLAFGRTIRARISLYQRQLPFTEGQ